MANPPTPQRISLHLEEQDCVLHNKTFYEKMDHQTLNSLIQFEGLSEKWNDANYSQQLASQHYANEKAQLKAYLKNYKQYNNAVSVRYMKTNRSKLGRVYPVKSLGLTTMAKRTRNTLIKDTMIDIDLCNAQPQILWCACIANNIECNFIEEYNLNREPILKEMMETYNLSRSSCKKLFIRLAFGGTFYGFLQDNDLSTDIKPTQFISDYTNQLIKIGNVFKKHNEDLYNKIKRNKKNNNNVMGSFMSKILQEHETRILECMYLWLRDNTNIVKGDFFVYEYDGMKLLKDRVEEYGVDMLMRNLENIVYTNLGFVMRLEVKPIDNYYDLPEIPEIIQAINDEFEKDEKILNLGDGRRDYDVAEYIYHKFCFKEGETDFSKKNQLVVSSGCKEKCKLWFSFKNGKWNAEKDSIFVAKSLVAEKFSKLVQIQIDLFAEQFNNVEITENNNTLLGQQYKNLQTLFENTRRNNSIKTIVDNLYDFCKIDDFEEKLDLNPNLVCCNNGVIDLKNKCFREGLPSDMCSLSTNIDYREVVYPLTLSDNTIIDEIDDFFYKLFPHESQRDYMLNHLASVFYGTTANQSFNYYIGGGSNGKSQLIDLMTYVMGDYKGSVPLTLITQKRASIGGTSSEVLNLRGVRYAVIQEPSKNDTINEGVMKELTGGDPITARGLWKEAITFKPMFDLAICANIFLNITSNDHGTWRRIKVVEFGSKFVDEGVCEEDYIFEKDLNLNKKFDLWKEYLLYKLIQIAFQNEGKVGVFSMVQSATERYRISQDKVGQYINDMIVPSDAEDALVLKTSLSKSFKEWCENKYKYSIKAKELFDRLDETYDSNYVKYKGFEIKGFSCEYKNDDKFIDKDEQFITEFEKKYEITMDLENDFVKRSNIQLWCKEHKLKLNTTKEITRVLLEKYKINCFNKEFCRDKKVNGKPIRVIFGIKLK